MAGIVRNSIFKRLAWHIRRVRKQFGGRVFRPLLIALVGVVFLASVGITIAEKGVTYRSFKSAHWRSPLCPARATVRHRAMGMDHHLAPALFGEPAGDRHWCDRDS
jgi:hypothetical protein